MCGIPHTLRVCEKRNARAETKSRQITRTSTKMMSLHRCDCGRDAGRPTAAKTAVGKHAAWLACQITRQSGPQAGMQRQRRCAAVLQHQHGRTAGAREHHHRTPRACVCNHLYWSVVTHNVLYHVLSWLTSPVTMCLFVGLSSFFLLPFYFLLRLGSQREIQEFSLFYILLTLLATTCVSTG